VGPIGPNPKLAANRQPERKYHLFAGNSGDFLVRKGLTYPQQTVTCPPDRPDV
jgi:hypothetical protein